MKIYNLLCKSSDGFSKKEVFVIGFYLSFLLVLFLAAILDLIIENYIDVYIEVLFFFLTVISMFYFKNNRNIEMASYFIVLITTLGSYIFLITNDFGISVFHSMVPLGYFLIFSLRRSLFYAFIHTLIVICIYIYAYHAYPNNISLHNSAVLVSMAMASLLMILFGIVYHFSVENFYIKLDESNRQKEILLKEVHHRVKNNLNIISSMLGLQMLREKDDTIKQVFQKNRLRIDSIAMVHEILYRHSDFESINIYEYLIQLSSMLLEMSDEDVMLHLQDKRLFLPFETVLKIGIITNELMVNSLKYAFNNEENMINILFEEEENAYIYIYSDSGTQRVDVDELEDNNKLGLTLVQLMIEQLDATIEISGERGLVYVIRIPKHV